MVKTVICKGKNNIYLITGKTQMWFLLNGRRYTYNKTSAEEMLNIIKKKDKRDNKLIAKSIMGKLNNEKVPYNSNEFVNMFIYLLGKL